MSLATARRLAKKLFPYWAAVWCAGLLCVAATLGASHLFTMPRPRTNDPALAASLAKLRGHERGALVFHVLYTECRCSRRIIDYLLERGPLDDAREHILLVGQATETNDRLLARRFQVHEVTQEALAIDYHITSAPLLVVMNEDDELRYVGGHTIHKQGLDYQDRAIVRDVVAGRDTRELPSFGCAVSRDLQERLDPLALKYAKERP